MRYEKNLAENSDLVRALEQKSRETTVTLVYAAHDELHNSALVLKRIIEKNLKTSLSPGKKRECVIPQGIFVPHKMCSYRWADSAPRVQKKECFMPISFATGHVPQIQVRSKSIHRKLLPFMQ